MVVPCTYDNFGMTHRRLNSGRTRSELVRFPAPLAPSGVNSNYLLHLLVSFKNQHVVDSYTSINMINMMCVVRQVLVTSYCLYPWEQESARYFFLAVDSGEFLIEIFSCEKKLGTILATVGIFDTELIDRHCRSSNVDDIKAKMALSVCLCRVQVC
jgi:hypothetical protein